MKNPFKTYNFWIKIMAAALLLAFGLWILIDTKMAVFIVLMFTGLVAGIFALVRTIPLLRTLRTHRARLTCFVEILLQLLVSAVLIFGALSILKDEEAQISKLINEYYRFVIAFFFMTRVVSYQMCTILFKEETDRIKFWVHTTLMLVACVLCSLSEIRSQTIALIIGVIALICSIGLIIDGAIGYGRYRKMIVKDREKKKEEQKQEEVGKEAPAQENVVVPVVDEVPQNDQAIIN